MWHRRPIVLRVPWRQFAIVLFDCDSTLSAVEGIDELAATPEQQQAIAELTDSAMTGAVPLEEVYGRRLALLNPTKDEVRAVKDRYKSAVVPDAPAVVAALDELERETWVISGGLYEPVVEFATWLGIDPSRVKAVNTDYDPLDGQWWGGAEQAPRYADYEKAHLHSSAGKSAVIRSAVTTPGRRLLVGDGISDLKASSAVDLFVAYAGVVDRPEVTEPAPVVIRSRSLAPVLALALGSRAVAELLGGPHDAVARSCLDAVADGALRFNDADMARRFEAASQ